MKKISTTLLLFCLMFSAFAQRGREIVYAGTFSVRGSEGIYVYELKRKKGTLEHLQTVKTLESPSFIAIHPSGKFLYSVNRGIVQDKKNSGSVSAYAIDAVTGLLTLVNHQPSYGNGPCHISVDQTGKLAFVSNYNEGNLVVFPLGDDGSLGAPSDSIRYSGRGPHETRQEKPHVHSATVSSDNRFLIVCDLGTDRVYSYAIDLAAKRLKPAEKPYVEVKSGSGPRHFAFHPNGLHAYLAEELTSTVCAFSYNRATGALDIIQDEVISLPVDFSGTNTSADIHTDPSGKFLMMSNRGHESLALFSINIDGTIRLKEAVETHGKKPRNFLIDPKNQFVFVAHQDTDNIVIFKWDAKKGKLTYSGNEVKVPSPVCLQALKLE
ncbi:beta-propeller fold lactonase family protein [Fulvivirgaceae bacterium PWU4]|uniref:Beta-propeller fold lactonase family protein n=1 Tax=Chryseosolibacter histidini TaxID=2782349 RepID=A0AAP2DHW4_9BACT|nr:lactonase family protein [Chryseosolibacter histidini]MBT1696435.1 beta-propeller fold lactonase family protein [Chryseosolibacter histidini]